MQLEDYQEELEEMKNMTRQEYVAHLRRYYYTLVYIHACVSLPLLPYIHTVYTPSPACQPQVVV
jgi:hypothetical protein